MAHPFSNRPDFEGLSREQFGFGTGRPLAPDAAAIVRNFAASIPRITEEDGTVWSGYANLYSDTLYTLAHGTPQEFDTVLGYLFATPLTHGFTQGHVVFSALKTVDHAWSHNGSIFMDRFYRLAEATGARRVQSREHTQTSIKIEDLDRMLADIEAVVGIDLTPPPQSGELFGVKLDKGVFCDRHFDGIYGAWRIRELARARGITDPSLVEIGGGAGFVAYYARKMGFKKIAVVDLKPVNMVQYMVLADAFGAEHASLTTPLSDGIQMVQADMAAATDFSGFDFVLNIDSLPEMPPSAASAYINAIQAGQFFLSINQESGYPNGDHAQNVVFELAAARKLRRVYRVPAWLRSGYVEEFYEG